MGMRYWDTKFHILVPLDPPNTIGWESRISFDISKASKHFVRVFQFQRNLDTNIIGSIDQIPTMLDHRHVFQQGVVAIP